MDHLAISDQKVKEGTGKNWTQWRAFLDAYNVKEKGHKETAKHLVARHKLTPWWAQVVTIRYEKERGYWQRSE